MNTTNMIAKTSRTGDWSGQSGSIIRAIKPVKLLMLLPLLSCLLLAAHFYGSANGWTAAACLLFPLVLFSRKRWVMAVFQLALATGALVWLKSGFSVFALLIFPTALIFFHNDIRKIFNKGKAEAVKPAIAAFLVTTGLLVIIQVKVKSQPMLLADRFLPGSGILEMLLLALYAGWITEKIVIPGQTAVIRRRIWTLFSAVFFTQLLIGILGIDQMLMTGNLHLPVPAMIVAGPLFRGEGIFMFILFSSTVLLVGPAWCSYLCYVGAVDNVASVNKKRPAKLPKWRHAARIGIFLFVVATAILLRTAGVPGLTATLAGAAFGLIGVGIMVFVSRKKGAMTHCITYCPIGLLANLMGKISPFRLRIVNNCTACSACSLVCRYGALKLEDIKKGRPGLTCTLCGDCITRCHKNSIEYRFLGLKPQTARYLFLVMVISIHAVFLGVARI